MRLLVQSNIYIYSALWLTGYITSMQLQVFGMHSFSLVFLYYGIGGKYTQWFCHHYDILCIRHVIPMHDIQKEPWVRLEANTYLGLGDSWIRFWPYFLHALPSSSLLVVTIFTKGLCDLPYASSRSHTKRKIDNHHTPSFNWMDRYFMWIIYRYIDACLFIEIKHAFK
jgi:hypothetical protein